MKNITIMEKTTIEKTTIAKITTTALLFFLALFTLTTNLKAQAQESGQESKQEIKTLDRYCSETYTKVPSEPRCSVVGFDLL